MSVVLIALLNSDRTASVLSQFVSFFVRLSVCTATMFALFVCGNSVVQAGDVELKQLSVGYDGVAKVARWLPFEATTSGWASEKAQLNIRAIDPRGDLCEFVFFANPEDGKATFSGCIRLGRIDGTLSFDFVDAESGQSLLRHAVAHSEASGTRIHIDGATDGASDPKAIASELKLHRLDVPFLMSVGPSLGIPEMLRNAATYANGTTIVDGVVTSSTRFPTNVNGLDGVDILVIGTDFRFTDDQSTAIRAWTEKGGRLLVSTGKNVSEFCDSSLGQWLATEFGVAKEPVSVREIIGLQNYVPRAQQIETNFNVIPMALATSPANVVEIDGTQSPIFVRQSIGLGTIDFFCIDLNATPVNKWPSLPQLYEQLVFGERLTRESKTARRSNRISSTGISDLATQLMAGLDARPNTGGWSTWSVMALLAVWCLIAGPLDYYLVVKVIKKPHLTWLTFPLLIMGGIWLTTKYASTDSTDANVNQFDFVSVYPVQDATVIRARSQFSVSSKLTQRVSPSVSLPKQMHSTSEENNLTVPTLGWDGRPEDVYGGLYRNEGIRFGNQTYQFDLRSPSQLKQVPLLTGGSRQFLAEWKTASRQPLLESNLTAAQYGQLRGTFTHRLPFEITDFLVVFRGNVYRQLESDKRQALRTGDTFEFAAGTVLASDLKAFLNGIRTVKAKRSDSRGSTQQNTAYDLSSRDPLYISTIMTLFEAAGGSDYVGLSNTLMNRDDLSETVKLNHAVLIGIGSKPVTQFSLTADSVSDTKNTTIVRLLLPVKFTNTELKTFDGDLSFPRITD